MGQAKIGWCKCSWCQQWQRTSITPSTFGKGNRRKCVYCGRNFKVHYKLDKLPPEARPEKPKMWK